MAWQPAHEAPGWWELLLKRYFPGAEEIVCTDWDAVVVAARTTGPGTSGVVWVRREIRGFEATGHLLNVHNDKGEVGLLDGMTGGLARLDTSAVRELRFARVAPAASASPPSAVEVASRREAADFPAAVEKAEAWLRKTYAEPVVLIDPQPLDELRRGWLFACNTKAFAEAGDWTKAMLDAALVVPKGPAEPFGLANSLPWAWLEAWDNGAEPGLEPGPGVLPFPPRPERAAWFDATMRELGTMMAASEHAEWGTLLDELNAMPVGARALVWVRRRDRRGRESVGLLLNGFRSENGTGIVDGSAVPITDLNGVDASGFRLIRYR